MTTRNKRKLAVLNKENCGEHPRSNLAQNSSAPRSQEDYITQVSEEIEGRVTKRLSKEFSRTENRILGALEWLDDFLMNPLLPGGSGTTPEPTRNASGINQGTNEDDSQNDPHPEASLFHGQREQNSGTERDYDMVTGVAERHHMVRAVQKESLWDYDMVTGATETNRNRHDMVTGDTEMNRNRHKMVTGVHRERVYGHDIVTGATQQIGNCHDPTGDHEEVTYCSPSTSSGKQKKNRSTSQPQFRSKNSPATIEADQILLALQQLANNNNSANFQNNINRISKLPKSLTTTMPTFDGTSEKFELFQDLFQTSLRIHNQLTEDDRINYFHSLMRRDALQTFKNINCPTRENLEEILTVFRRKYVKPQSMATAKHKFQKLVFNPSNQKLADFLDELQKLAKDAFGKAAHAIIEQFIYAKMPPHLKKSINQAHLENGTYEQIVTHLERELELNGLEAPDELPINNVSQQPRNTNADRPKPTCHHCKKPGHYRNQCRLLKKQREQTENNQNNPRNKNSVANISNPNSNINNTNNNKNSNKAERKPETVYPPCETCGKTNHSADRCYVGANAANRPLPWKSKPEGQSGHHQQDAQNSITGCVLATAQHLI